MSYPPDRRRRKLRRNYVLAFVGIAMLCTAGAGVSYWEHTRFPAHSVWLDSAPIGLRVQDGVDQSNLDVIGEGLRLADRFMRTRLGRTVERPVDARIAHDNPCRPYESTSDGSIAEAGDGFLCIETRNLHWQWLVEKDRAAAIAVAAHEYVHVLQAELGCLAHGATGNYRWLVEGMADDIAWRALVQARVVSARQVAGTLRQNTVRIRGIHDRGLGPLAAYESGGGADREYALWQLAVRHLVRWAVDDRVAPKHRPEIALRRFCERVGQGMGWRRAFARSFGEPVKHFYARFETFRRRAGDT